MAAVVCNSQASPAEVFSVAAYKCTHMILSATGSRNAPKALVSFIWRATHTGNGKSWIKWLVDTSQLSALQDWSSSHQPPWRTLDLKHTAHHA